MNTQERKFTFKTNINCGGCVAKMKPVLDKAIGISSWSVNTEDPNKTLFVSGSISEQEIIDLVKANGFKIESVN